MNMVKLVNRSWGSRESIDCLFWSYFNNKMMMLLMMIEHPYISRNTLSVEKQKMFLHDVYHHFLPPRSSKECHDAFRWLNRFLNQFPDVGPKRIQKGIQMVEKIYEVFGFKLEERIEKVRIQREMLPPERKEES